MARYYVFATQAQAQACVDGIDARAREVYAAKGFTQDEATGGYISRDTDGDNIPGAVTVTFAQPRQRMDGRWVVPHCEVAPYAAEPVSPTLTVAGYVAQGIAADTSIETVDAAWWPPSPVLQGAR